MLGIERLVKNTKSPRMSIINPIMKEGINLIEICKWLIPGEVFYLPLTKKTALETPQLSLSAI